MVCKSPMTNAVYTCESHRTFVIIILRWLMKRYILDDLIKWKNNKNRKPLIMTGIRQCGKTYILKNFGDEYYEDFAYINLERNPQIGQIFDRDFDVNRIINEISNFYLHKEIIPGKTLFVIDEIQNHPRAITSFKYFQEEMPELDIIGAGSLLGVSIRKEQSSFPVGKVDRLEMFPMSFKEFLWASEYKNIDKTLATYSLLEPLPDYIFQSLTDLYFQYLIVGGMPEAVKTWFDSKNIEDVYSIQDNIIYGYENDFSKHAPIEELTNIQLIWKSVPEQLAKDNNKFVFSNVKKSARAKDLEKSLGWLVDAGLVHILTKVENAKIPLSANEVSNFYKVYFADTGLLCRISNFTLNALMDNVEASGGFRGSLTENFMLTQLKCLGYRPYFWRSGNTAELDFLLEEDGQVIPIEAKANINTQAKSYSTFVRKYRPKIGFKFSLKNIGDNYVGDALTYSLPLFYISKIREYINM